MSAGIECRAYKRPQGVTWVESVRGSHADLPVHLSLLVSESGLHERTDL